ncbi:hypothetical protein [Leptodesmis sp.]|uniref:hypothetical protein n=1 Tax=Leptodesmis sp. TaxID=3100501 RepID=UPI0040535A9E
MVQSQPLPVPSPGSSSANQNLACQPPASGEYLLLVVTRTSDSQTQVKQLLPPNTSVAICNYLNDTVTRVGGFRTVERANAWARYITDTTGLAAFVARPAETPASPNPVSGTPGQASTLPSPGGTKPVEPAQTATQSSANLSTGYNPKPLGPGYAVLVDYFNQPELATRVQQLLGRPIGVVSYGQRPYLLAIYTTDQNAAHITLQALSDRGFWATIVDSRRVVLLRQSVALQ